MLTKRNKYLYIFDKYHDNLPIKIIHLIDRNMVLPRQKEKEKNVLVLHIDFTHLGMKEAAKETTSLINTMNEKMVNLTGNETKTTHQQNYIYIYSCIHNRVPLASSSFQEFIVGARWW